MTMYEGRQHKPKKSKTWPIVAAVLGVFAICGACALAGTLGLFKLGNDVTSTAVAVDSSAGVGQSVEDGGLRFIVEKVDCSALSLGSEPITRRAQGRFCVVTLTATNLGSTAAMFVSSYQKGLDSSGREYSTDDAAALLVTPDAWLSQINPASTMRGCIVFDVPKDVQLVSLVLHGGWPTAGINIKI
jgi:hypothetical protein